VLDVNGVGYEMVTPLGTVGRAKATPDGKVTLFIHTHVREDQLSLFGFASEGDRLAFRTLIGVSSVGPKTAIAVLSALPAHELGTAIARKELGKLTAISGIGKKTAERLLLELKDKLEILQAAPPSRAAAGGAPINAAAPPTAHADVLARALVNMGYKSSEADRAIEHLRSTEDDIDGKPLTDLIKQALAFLAK
jgi:Holliday junction DNA helicase RuvA